MKNIISILLCSSFLLCFPTCVYAEIKSVPEEIKEQVIITGTPNFIEICTESIELESFLKDKAKAYKYSIKNSGKNDIQIEEIKNTGLSSWDLKLYRPDGLEGALVYGIPMVLFHLPVIPFYVWKNPKKDLNIIKYTLLGIVALPLTVPLSLIGGTALGTLKIQENVKTYDAKKEAEKFQELSFPITIKADESIKIHLIKSRYNRRNIEFKITDGENVYLISK